MDIEFTDSKCTFYSYLSIKKVIFYSISRRTLERPTPRRPAAQRRLLAVIMNRLATRLLPRKMVEAVLFRRLLQMTLR